MILSPLEYYHWAISVLTIDLQALYQLCSFSCPMPMYALPMAGVSTVSNLSLNININIDLLRKTR